MKTRKWFERACALTIAVATVATSLVFAPVSVDAADAFYVNFVDNITGAKGRTTTLLEGETIKTETKMPENYSFNPRRPFNIVGIPETAPLPITAQPTGDSITANLLVAPNEMVSHTLQPAFSAYLTRSDTGSLSYVTTPAVGGAPAETKNVFLEAEIGNKDIAVQESSTLEFKVSDDQTIDADGKVNELINFGAATATGGLIDFNGGQVDYNGRDGARVKIVISKAGKKLNLTLSSNFPTQLLKDSTFKLTFTLQEVADMILTIISQQRAVNEIALQIAAEAYLDKYIKLKAGDQTNAITSSFSVAHIVKEYNSKSGFKIAWDWAPAAATGDDDVVQVIKEGLDYATTWTVRTKPKLENVNGSLKATVSYTKDNATVTSAEVEIPITVLGTGTYPEVKPVYSYKGARPEVVTPITQVPTKLDVNDGSFSLVTFPPDEAYKFTAELKYGTGLGKAENVKIEFNTQFNGKVDIYIDNSTSAYVPGTMLPVLNDSSGESIREMMVQARGEGLVSMKVTYYNKSGDAYKVFAYTIEIGDSSPKKDPSLKSLKTVGTTVSAADLKAADATLTDAEANELEERYRGRFTEIYPNGVIDFGFNLVPDQNQYAITVPWAVKEVTLTPIYKNPGVKKSYDIYVQWNGNPSGNDEVSGKEGTTPPLKLPTTKPIPLSETGPQVVTIKCTAEDGVTLTMYTLTITRAPKSDIASLKSLSLTTTRDNEEKVLVPSFQPEIYTYNLSLPYTYRGTSAAKLLAVATGDWGAKPAFSGNPVVPRNFWARIFQNKNEADLNLSYTIEPNGDIKNMNTVIITVVSEDKKKSVDYTLNIKIEDPSENNELSSMEIYTKGNDMPLELYNKQKFVKEGREYYLEVPYQTEELRFELLPDDEKAQNVRVTHPALYPPQTNPPTNPQVLTYKQKGTPVKVSVKIPPTADYARDKEFTYQFEVQAESDKWTGDTTTPYILHITRLEPNEDSRLASMTVTDSATDKAVDDFKFVQIQNEYTFSVPFTTESVVVSPLAVVPALSTVTVDGTKITETMKGKIVKLNAGVVTTINVLVVPEAGAAFQTLYKLNITRKAAGTDARLQKLEVGGGTEMTPAPFVPSVTNYAVTIPEGTVEYTIIPTPVDPNATITVNGTPVENGKPSKSIVSTEPYSNVTVIVTAQDGKTKMTYTIRIKDYNLIKKSSNADLSDLKVNYGDLSPSFRSNIDEYELYVKPETDSLDLTPVLANNNATTKVSVDSKELTRYSGVYSSSLFVNKTTFTVDVTAEDGVTKKTYTINVIRNDKKKQGAFKPITSAMVDYESHNPIVIDISNYAIIDASVFNKLKTDYPDKTIVFQGNDYMMSIVGKDIKDLVPHTTHYDLYFSFTTPEEQMIQDLLYEDGHDMELEPVYLYFDDHGPLPAKMLLTVSLGREYKNDQLFWNYYNLERDRIDYYGYVNSNGKGTFTVPITHLSTYMVARRKIVIAEDKTGSNFGLIDTGTSGGSGTGGGSENANGGTTQGKDNPQTGVK